MTKEIRAGLVTINIICDHLKEYIKAHTEGDRYLGDINYFGIYHSMKRFLNKHTYK